jgi:hypothetical protein
MADVFQCLQAISILPWIVERPVTFFTEMNITYCTPEKFGRGEKARCSFQVEAESLKLVKELLEIFKGSLSEIRDVLSDPQEALSVASTEGLKEVLTQLIEGDYLGDWVPSEGRGNTWGFFRHNERKKFKLRRLRVRRLVALAAEWLRQPRQRQGRAAIGKGSSCDELALLQDTAEGFRILMKQMDDLREIMSSRQS